jgi:phage tail sheath gpL-like
MNIALNTAVTGMLNAQAQAGAASSSLVNAAAKGDGIIQAMIAVKRAEVAQQASASMVKVADDMMQTVLDITV